MEWLGNRIKSFRERINLTQTQLADRIGVSRAAVVQWEGGITDLNLSRLIEIATALDVTLSELLSRPEDAHRQSEADFLSLTDPSPRYTKGHKMRSDREINELEHLRIVNEHLEKHLTDQELLIELMKERLELPNKLPKKVSNRLTRKEKQAS